MRLTEEYVLAKTRQAELGAVRNLNLWGNGISDISARCGCHVASRAARRRGDAVARRAGAEARASGLSWRCDAR